MSQENENINLKSTKIKEKTLCVECDKSYSDIKSHNRFKHSEIPTTIKCAGCKKDYNRYYIKKHKCSYVKTPYEEVNEL
jgi:hypothetical protein